MDQITHAVRRQHWLSIVNACQTRTEDITVKQWLKDNGVKEKAYYYWLRKFRRESFEHQMSSISPDNKVSFAEILLQNEPVNNSFAPGFKADAIIKTEGCIIALSNTASESLCRIILEGLDHAL